MIVRCKTCGCGPYDTLSIIEGGNCMECDEAIMGRVAAAIAEARCSLERPDPGKGLDEYLARAAIEAMKEPTR